MTGPELGMDRVNLTPPPVREFAEQVETPGVDAQYRVTYERVGRRRDVPPLVVVAAGADDLAERIYDDARPYLMSQDVDVAVDLETMTGTIFCGVRSGGQFTIEALTSGDGPR